MTGTVFTVAGGDHGHASVAMADAAHAFTVAAYVLAGVAAAAGLVAVSRAGGTLASATLSAVE